MSERPRKPVAMRLDSPDVRIAAPGSEEAPLLDRRVVVVPEAPQSTEEDMRPAQLPRRGRWGALLVAALGGIASLAAGVSAARLVDELFTHSQVLGWVGIALLGLLVLAAVVLVARELSALRRLGRVEQLRERAALARATDDRTAARALARDLRALYAGRPDTAQARGELDRSLADIVDGADLVRLTEQALMADLDRRAVRLVVAAAKRVSLVTAISPRAVFDVLMVVSESARLVRALADLYGARPGKLGMLRLARAVTAHLAITGGMAMGESLVQQLVGHGLAARLSAKLGEGVVNGLMTARVGLSTIDLVRPMPFDALERPKLGSVIAELTTTR
jgi:putative membrane protein